MCFWNCWNNGSCPRDMSGKEFKQNGKVIQWGKGLVFKAFLGDVDLQIINGKLTMVEYHNIEKVLATILLGGARETGTLYREVCEQLNNYRIPSYLYNMRKKHLERAGFITEIKAGELTLTALTPKGAKEAKRVKRGLVLPEMN